jgi:DNA mismatch repair protein MutL
MAVADALSRAPVPGLTLGTVVVPEPAGVAAAAPLPLPAALPTPYPTVFPSRWSGAVREEGPTAHFARVEAVDATSGGAQSPGTLMPLGQFRDTFIVAVDEEGIAIIDQHVAHERMLFERITERLTSGPLESQRLLEPMLVEVASEGHQALLAHAGDLERLGFEIEDFGADAVRLSACPALLSREESRAALRDLAEDLEQLDRGRAVVDAVKRIAATMACHAAVKANYPLTHEKMLHILDGVRRTAYSTVCPHGRPVMLRLTRAELEKRFERV